MATAVFFHAHPDDEAIATGGAMAKAARDGHRVVLVLATRGELGEPVPGVLRDGEALWERRVEETHAAARTLGVQRVEFLGYRDSGMMGESTNDDADSFWQADRAEAAARLAAILRDERADVLIVYDDHGGYGHPDHIQVHRVGIDAAGLAGVATVFESTMNRDLIKRSVEEMADTDAIDAEERRQIAEAETFGSPEALITHAVDVHEFIDTKRAAMRQHASQIPEDSFFLQMAPDVFARAFGTEWFIQHGKTRPPEAPFETDLFAS